MQRGNERAVSLSHMMQCNARLQRQSKLSNSHAMTQQCWSQTASDKYADLASSLVVLSTADDLLVHHNSTKALAAGKPGLLSSGIQHCTR